MTLFSHEMLYRCRFMGKVVLAIVTIFGALFIIPIFGPVEEKIDMQSLQPVKEERIKEIYNINYTTLTIEKPYPKSLERVPVIHTVGDLKEGFLQTRRPFSFLKMLKNPCYFENDCGCLKMPLRFRCLPYFHLVGFPKTGSTDLWALLVRHPDILNIKKETNYWSATRYMKYGRELRELQMKRKFHDQFTVGRPVKILEKEQHKPFCRHVDRHYNASKLLLRKFEVSEGEKVSAIFGEGSVTYAYSSLGIRTALGSIQFKSPEEIDTDLAKVLSWITPDAKIIISLRNPTDRLYSDYRNLFNGLVREQKSKEHFHSMVEERIELWNKCRETYTQERCVSSPAFEIIGVHTGVFGLVRGMYSTFIRQWLNSFPKEQIIFVRLEDRKKNVSFIQDVYRFLDIRPLNDDEFKFLASNLPKRKPKRVKDMRRHQVGRGEPMMAKTREILEKFYEPFNRDLADLLGDNRFLWTNG